MNINWAKESPEKAYEQNEINTKRAKMKRVNESPEIANGRNERNAKRTNESPEKAYEQKEKNADMVRGYQLKKIASHEACNKRKRKQILQSADQSDNAEELQLSSNNVKTKETIISVYKHLMKTELKKDIKIRRCTVTTPYKFSTIINMSSGKCM